MIPELITDVLHKAFDSNYDFVLLVKDHETRNITIASNVDDFRQLVEEVCEDVKEISKHS